MKEKEHPIISPMFNAQLLYCCVSVILYWYVMFLIFFNWFWWISFSCWLCRKNDDYRVWIELAPWMSLCCTLPNFWDLYLFLSSLAGSISQEKFPLLFADDYRLFCGDLGNEVNDDVLSKAFSRFPSFNMARVSLFSPIFYIIHLLFSFFVFGILNDG